MRRIFVPSLSAATFLALGMLRGVKEMAGAAPEIVIDPRVASQRKSNFNIRPRSKYMPHQGDRERARRRKQMRLLAAKRAIEEASALQQAA